MYKTMKKSFTIKSPEVKARGHMAPPPIPHRDKRNDYSRRKFKNSRNWD